MAASQRQPHACRVAALCSHLRSLPSDQPDHRCCVASAPPAIITTDRSAADVAIRYNQATARSFPPSASVNFRRRTPALGGDATESSGHLQLHVFLPEPEPELRAGRAAVVFFSEGGWRAIDACQFFPQCARLAANGIVAVAAE